MLIDYRRYPGVHVRVMAPIGEPDAAKYLMHFAAGVLQAPAPTLSQGSRFGGILLGYDVVTTRILLANYRKDGSYNPFATCPMSQRIGHFKAPVRLIRLGPSPLQLARLVEGYTSCTWEDVPPIWRVVFLRYIKRRGLIRLKPVHPELAKVLTMDDMTLQERLEFLRVHRADGKTGVLSKAAARWKEQAWPGLEVAATYWGEK